MRAFRREEQHCIFEALDPVILRRFKKQEEAERLAGEFGEVDKLGMHGGEAASTVLWGYTFIVQIVLVNLLIAMMAKSFDIIWEQQVRIHASSFDPPCISPHLLSKPFSSSAPRRRS